MAQLARRCEKCSGESSASVGDLMFDGRLVWYESFWCPSCGTHLEIDGHDAAPEEIRKAILAQEGEWSLLVEETGKRRLLALKVVRTVLGLSLDEIGTLRTKIPGPLLKGTQAEMEYVRFHLLSADLQATIKCL